MKRGIFPAFAFLAILAATAPLGLSQAVRATLVGRVTDQSAAVVPGTKVTLTNIGTNETHVVTVADNGEFVF